MKTNKGFSLIEVLVTLLLTSIGILGMIAMQTKAIAYTQDSIQRNTAATLVDELMEIMRADQDKILTINGRPREVSDSDYYKKSGDPFPEAADDCSNLPDNPAERLGCWVQRAEQRLPGVTELLTNEFHIQPKNATIEVQVAWSVAEGACDQESTVCHYRLRAEL